MMTGDCVLAEKVGVRYEHTCNVSKCSKIAYIMPRLGAPTKAFGERDAQEPLAVMVAHVQMTAGGEGAS